jgi:L-amino acid N-acyltransferase YncA
MSSSLCRKRERERQPQTGRGGDRIAGMATQPTPESGPRLLVRPAREDDAASLREIYNEAIQDELATFDVEARSVEEQRRLIEAAESDPTHPVLVAELRGWTLGWITIQPHDRRVDLEDIGEVTVFVRRSFRSYGVGRQLMQAIQQQAPDLGYRKLMGQVLADHRGSLQLCKVCGWREVGRLEKHARHPHGLRDVMLLEFLIPQKEA